jgi:PPOX class probable F420-dependent enzyme
MVRIPDEFLDLLRGRAYGHLATLMSDGAPQVTPVWVDLIETPDGHIVRINSARGRIKNRNMERRPQVALEISDPDDPFRYVSIRGRVTAVTEEGAAEHADALSERYLGKPYPWWRPGEVREIFHIALDRVRTFQLSEPD